MTAICPPAPRRRHSDAAPWIVSALVILALHAGGIVALLASRVPVDRAEPPGAAIMVDLTPQAIATPPAPAPAPPPAKIEEPTPPPASAAPPEPMPEPQPELMPEPPAAPAPTVAVPPPPRKPVERKRVRPRVVAPLQPRSPPIAPTPPATEVPSAPAAAAPHPAQPAPSVAAAPSAEMLSAFEKALLSHLEREKRYPRSAQLRREQGVVYLRFTMDRAGKVLAARIERGSGHEDLDKEVLALISRAEPLPSFPPDMPQAELELVVPIRFLLR